MTANGHSSITFLTLFIAAGIAHAQETRKCGPMINEINFNGPEKGNQPDLREFIEFKTDCDTKHGDVSMSDYTLVAWKGRKAPHLPVVELIIPLSGFFQKESPYFVIANASEEVAKELRELGVNTPTIYNFKDFPGGQGNRYLTTRTKKHALIHKEYLTNGNGNAVALCLYKNLVPLLLNSSLTPETANIPNLVDVVIYHDHGSGEYLIKMLFPPEYALPRVKIIAEGIILKDGDNGTQDFSLSFCCPTALHAKWPLAFTVSNMTPGRDNDCRFSKFALEKVGKELDTAEERCDYPNLQKFMADNKGKKIPNKEVMQSDEPQIVPRQGSAEKTGQAILETFVEKPLSTLKDGVESTEHQFAETIKSTERQVTLLASVVGTLIFVVCVVGLIVGYVWIRRKNQNIARLGSRRYRYQPQIEQMERVNIAGSEAESENEEVFRRPHNPVAADDLH